MKKLIRKHYCRKCGASYVAEFATFICPECNQPDYSATEDADEATVIEEPSRLRKFFQKIRGRE